MNRVAFLVDGFNVYHSVKQAIKDDGGASSLKWLDLKSLCDTYVRSGVFGSAATLERVIYFSAYATFLTAKDPGVVLRHRTFVTALQASGVELVLGRFKWKPRWCKNCKKEVPGHEEKETDVSIAVKVMELCFTNACDTIVLVTGDTDLLPAIRTARQLWPDKQMCVAFPYARFNEELRQASDKMVKIKRSMYAGHQLPDPVKLSDGSWLPKPTSW